MNPRAPLTLLGLTSVLFLVAPAQGPRDPGAAGGIGMAAAIGKALAARPGEAVEIERDTFARGVHRVPVWEVVVVSETALHEVVVAVATGEVLGQEICDDADEKAELKEFRRLLRPAELPLADLVGKAEALVRGRPVTAKLKGTPERPVAEVKLVNGQYGLEVRVEARAGLVVDIALRHEAGPGDGSGEAKGKGR